jgi:PKD repeat protein
MDIDFYLSNAYLACKLLFRMKLKHLLLASASGAILFGGAAHAQTQRNYGCYTDEYNKEMEAKYPESVKNRQVIEQQIRQYVNQNPSSLKKAGPVLKIPVVVHVVTEKGLNGISKAQVLNGVQILNEDFRRLNLDKTVTRAIFQPIASDLEIEFVMARIDPDGHPTEGIDRVTSVLTNGPLTRDEVKAAAPAWPTNQFFNVWLVQTINSTGAAGGGTILGYAQFPGSGPWNNYGLVMLHTQWGKQGVVPGSTADSDGRTATHEAGHCFNLYHTFQNQQGTTGCGASGYCDTSGDLVCDTPPALQDTYLGCNNNLDNCTNDKWPVSPTGTQTNPYIPMSGSIPTQTENYMSYDLCQNMFTAGQNIRAHAALNTIPQLQNLVSAANADTTGINPAIVVGPLVPVPYFGVANDHICEGSSITFTDATYNGTPTSWNWSFPGGTPSTSTAQNPVVMYTTSGYYPVTLTASNAAGARTVTKNNFVRVVPTTNLPKVMAQQQYQESFETAGFPANANANFAWERYTTAATPVTPGFDQTTLGASNGTTSLRLRNASSNVAPGTYSTIITPNIDVAGTTGVVVNFDLAYGKNSTAAAGEELRVYVSNNCGLSWGAPRYTKIGDQLITNGGVIVGSFIPGPNDWRTEPMAVQNNLLTTGHIMLKFEALSKGGNALFIDNVRVFTVLGNGNDLAQSSNIKLYPNPLTNETGINFDLKTPEKVSFKILDIVGNTIYEGADQTLASGSHTIPVYNKLKGSKAGMYMVQLTIGNKVYNTKLIAQ